MLPASAIFPARPLHLACHRPRGEITMSLQQEVPGWWQGTVVLLAAAQIAGQVGLISLPGRHESSAAADQPERAMVVVATLDHPPPALKGEAAARISSRALTTTGRRRRQSRGVPFMRFGRSHSQHLMPASSSWLGRDRNLLPDYNCNTISVQQVRLG